MSTHTLSPRKDRSLVIGVSTLACLLIFGAVCAPMAFGAEVAVMPVHGVNLSPGECDAIGVVFSSAFARDANVAVLSPLQTKEVRARAQSATAAAETLGASYVIELTAIRLQSKVKLSGVLSRKDGGLLYRADTVAPSVDEAAGAASALAHALVFRQPVPAPPSTEAISAGSDDSATAPEEAVDAPPATASPRSSLFGFKVGLTSPISSGRSFSPLGRVQFDARFGTGALFFEFGGGFERSLSDPGYSGDSLAAANFFADFGGGAYVWSESTALYLAAGLSPALWNSKTYASSKTGATAYAHGQLGLGIGRDRRAKMFLEVQLSQILIGVSDPVSGSSNNRDSYHPTMISMQGGAVF